MFIEIRSKYQFWIFERCVHVSSINMRFLAHFQISHFTHRVASIHSIDLAFSEFAHRVTFEYYSVTRRVDILNTPRIEPAN